MSERADLYVADGYIATGTGRLSDESEHRSTWYRPLTDDDLRGMASELLPILLPDVDWEALRDEASSKVHYDYLARRLLAVYDGKDG